MLPPPLQVHDGRVLMICSTGKGGCNGKTFLAADTQDGLRRSVGLLIAGSVNLPIWSSFGIY